MKYEISIELFHDLIKASDGRAAFVARLDPDRVKMESLRRRKPPPAGRVDYDHASVPEKIKHLNTAA
jgi:hypothetical protein